MTQKLIHCHKIWICFWNKQSFFIQPKLWSYVRYFLQGHIKIFWILFSHDLLKFALIDTAQMSKKDRKFQMSKKFEIWNTKKKWVIQVKFFVETYDILKHEVLRICLLTLMFWFVPTVEVTILYTCKILSCLQIRNL